MGRVQRGQRGLAMGKYIENPRDEAEPSLRSNASRYPRSVAAHRPRFGPNFSLNHLDAHCWSVGPKNRVHEVLAGKGQLTMAVIRRLLRLGISASSLVGQPEPIAA